MAEKTNTFPSAVSLFAPSIAGVQRNLVSLVVVGFMPVLFLGLGVLSQVTTTETEGFLRGLAMVTGLVLFALGIVFSLTTGPGFSYIQYQSAKNVTIMPLAVYKKIRRYGLRWWGMTIVVNAIYLAAFLCLIVPLFFMIKRYMLASYYLFEKDLPIFEAMSQSASDSQSYPEAYWGVIGTQMVLGVTLAIPVIGIIFGWIPTVLYSCAPALRYTQIQAAKKTHPRYPRR